MIRLIQYKFDIFYGICSNLKEIFCGLFARIDELCGDINNDEIVDQTSGSTYDTFIPSQYRNLVLGVVDSRPFSVTVDITTVIADVSDATVYFY